MTIEEFEAGYQYTIQVLDNINIKPFLEVGYDVETIMNNIRDNAYSDEITAMIENTPLNGMIFNFFNEQDFITYINKRYPEVTFEEGNTYWVTSNGAD